MNINMNMPHSTKEIMKPKHEKANVKDTYHDSSTVRKSMQYHLERLTATYESQSSKLAEAKSELKELEEDLKIRKEKIQFMNREALHARKTFRRKVAQNLMNYQWYYSFENRKKISLEKGWDYYENNILPRHFCDEKAKSSVNLERASPGEYNRDTKLYDPFFTPHEELADFGIGVGLYFSILRFFCLLLFFIALFNLSLLEYYQSDEYSEFKFEGNWLTNSSAVCSSTQYVPCLDCNEGKWDSTSLQKRRFRFGRNIKNETDTIAFVLRNDCPFIGLDRGIGFLVGTIAFVVIGLFVTNYFVKKGEQVFDENVQTAQDYSVEVTNPPQNAFDCNQWRKYFQMVTKRRVTIITVTLDNHKLLKLLVKRRKLLQILSNNLKTASVGEEKPSRLDEAIHPNRILNEALKYGKHERSRKDKPVLTKCSQKLESLRHRDPIRLVYKIANLKTKIQELLSPEVEYKVKRVFVTFEEEKGKREALKILGNPIGEKEVSHFPTIHGAIPLVVEPSEPGSIRWTDIGNDSIFRNLFSYLLHVTAISIIATAVGLILKDIQENSIVYAFVVYFFGNIVGPFLCQVLHDYEVHSTNTSYYIWLFIKVFFLKIGVTVLTLIAIVPNTSMLEDSDGSFIETLHWIFVFDVVIHPIAQIVDLREIFYQHLLAPRAKSQEELQKIFFDSTPPQNIVYSYADMYKMLMLSLIYSILYPAGLFLGSFYMFIYYFVDRYCLMRHWAPFPDVGTVLNAFSRNFAQPICVLVLVVLSCCISAGFPFDNLCQSADSSDLSSVFDGATYSWGDKSIDTYTFTSNSTLYSYCDQDVMRRIFDRDAVSFIKPVESTSSYTSRATDSQREIAEIFLYVALVVFALYGILVFGRSLVNAFIRLACDESSYKSSADGQIQNIDFSNVEEICGYIPQISVDGIMQPLLLCDLDQMEETNYIGFDIPDSVFGERGTALSYDGHNVIFDVKYEGMKRERLENMKSVTSHRDWNTYYHQRKTPIFATVKYWPPSWTFGNDDEIQEDLIC